MEKSLCIKKRILVVLLISLILSIIIVPQIEAYYTDGMKVGDKYKTTKLLSVYRNEKCTVITKILGKNKEFTIQEIKGNVIKIGDKQYIKCTKSNLNKYKKVSSATKKVNVTDIQLIANEFLDITKPSIKLTATITPNNATNKKIQWTSSDTKVAKVDQNGNVTRVGEGSVNIIAKVDGKQAICKVTVKKEKVIICGPSTVACLAGTRDISNKDGVRWEGNYSKYGYKKNSDLYFICKSGAGLKYFAGETYTKGKSIEEYFDQKLSGKNEGKDRLIGYLDEGEKNNYHFTVILVGSGNDLMAKMSEENVKNIAMTYVEYLNSLSDEYPMHTFYAFPATPVDEAHVNTENNEEKKLLVQEYGIKNSNNLKRYTFAKTLKEEITKKNKSNLKYPVGTFIDLLEQSSYKSGVLKRVAIKEGKETKTYNVITKKLGNGKYVGKGTKYTCFDGKHYDANGCQFMMGEILKRCGVLDSNMKKK